MHFSQIKISRILPLTIVLLGAILSIACENDTKDIDRLANIKAEEAVDISKDVTVIYSDSAKVKAELKAPEMRVYHGTVIKTEELIYDENNKKYYGSQPITAEYNDGRTSAQGTSFTANEDFNDIRFMNGTAIHYPSSDSQLPSFGN